jgi:predicted DNA-binding transcriptional regulator AlpA
MKERLQTRGEATGASHLGSLEQPTVSRNPTRQSLGLLRLSSIIAPNGPIPVGKSTWWAGVKTGRYPKPIKLGPRITVWRIEDIRALMQTGSQR